MSQNAGSVLFLITQLLLPLGVGFSLCKSKDIPFDSWMASGIGLVCLGVALFVFTGLFNLPTHVRWQGMVADRSLGLVVGPITIAIGVVIAFLAHRFEGLDD